jgi:molecular chaperone HscB
VNGPGAGPFVFSGPNKGTGRMNYFEVFGLPRRLGIDAAELQQKFYERARRDHPDFHHAAPADEQDRALAASALLNAAYRALRDPIARVEYLVRLEEGRETREGSETKPKAPPSLLQEMFEIQEALQEAKADGLSEAGRATLTAQRDGLQARRRAEEDRLRGELSQAWDAADPADRPRLLAALKESLGVRAYLRTVIQDLDETLEEGREEHVAHRRH